MENDKNVLLTVSGLKTYFKTMNGVTKAVDDVSFTIEKGKIVGVVGESGCGKSVMSRSILNIIQPPGKIIAGQVMINDNGNMVDLLQLPPRGRQIRQYRGKRIAMIFQEPMISLSPIHTVGYQLAESLKLYYPGISKDEIKKKSIKLLEDVGIPSPEKQLSSYVFELSGGMRQRVMIALALSGEPDLLIADEPTTAIDVTIQAKILELLKEINQRTGMAILIITHNMGVVAQIADEIIVMYLGKIAEQGSVTDIFHAPRHPYTKRLLESIPSRNKVPQSELLTIEGSIPDSNVEIKGCPFWERCEYRHECKGKDELPDIIELPNGQKVRCFMPR